MLEKRRKASTLLELEHNPQKNYMTTISVRHWCRRCKGVEFPEEV
ncbi:hypothetical protein LINPERHAP2_LOCUS43151, partial [Linum perenne]